MQVVEVSARAEVWVAGEEETVGAAASGRGRLEVAVMVAAVAAAVREMAAAGVAAGGVAAGCSVAAKREA